MGLGGFSGYDGEWVGSNGFRLMPHHELATRSASATLSLPVAANLLSLAYRWEHPADGPQDGLVVVGAGDEADSVLGLWGDSWHQQPQPMSMSGHLVAGAVHLSAEYGDGWGWNLIVDAVAPVLRMRMENVIPADQANATTPAGAYEVMLMELTRPA